MKSNHILYICTTLLLLAGCKKVNDSLENRNIYAGRVLIADTINNNTSLALPSGGIDVYVYRQNDNYYLYKKTTDARGFFTMDFLKAGEKYRITASATLNELPYAGDTSFLTKEGERTYYLNMIGDSVHLTLYPNTGNNCLLRIDTRDSLGGILPKTEVSIYSSAILFANGNKTYANYSADTDPSGRVNFTIPTPGKYYILAQKSIDTVKWVCRDSVILSKGKLNSVTMQLRK